MQLEKTPSLELKLPETENLFAVENPVINDPPEASIETVPETNNETAPEIAIDEEGNIRFKKNGEPALKRGRKKGGVKHDAINLLDSNDPLAMTQGQLATTLTGGFFAIGQTLCDQIEWTPSDNEFLTNRNALLAVLQKRQVTASPEIQAGIAFGTSILSRIAMPRTSAKIGAFKDKIFNKFKRKAVSDSVKGFFKRKDKDDKSTD